LSWHKNRLVEAGVGDVVVVEIPYNFQLIDLNEGTCIFG